MSSKCSTATERTSMRKAFGSGGGNRSSGERRGGSEKPGTGGSTETSVVFSSSGLILLRRKKESPDPRRVVTRKVRRRSEDRSNSRSASASRMIHCTFGSLPRMLRFLIVRWPGFSETASPQSSSRYCGWALIIARNRGPVSSQRVATG
jgi:hypothetical protein